MNGPAASGSFQQMADPNFDARVPTPAYTTSHPRLLFDQAHNNFHTASGRYKPLADLLTNDGYQIRPNHKKFDARSLADCGVLLVANAKFPGKGMGPAETRSAFNTRECDAVRDWVRGGGSLLLIADHAPFGNAAKQLAAAVGVDMSAGTTMDRTNFDKDSGSATFLVFSRDNGLLGDHAITRGRNETERLNKVVTFTGQSLKGPVDSAEVLKLGDTAKDMPALTPEQWKAALAEARKKAKEGKGDESSVQPPGIQLPRGSVAVRVGDASSRRLMSAAGRDQCVAFELGKGRVVVLGEAGVLSAQVVTGMPGGQGNQKERRFGMNYPGTDDRQFALNIMHWLSRLLN
jgi:hypothetical protein